MLAINLPIQSLNLFPFGNNLAAKKFKIPRLDIQQDMPLKFQECINQEFTHFQHRCDYWGISLSSIKKVNIQKGSFDAARVRGGYRLYMDASTQRFSVANKNAMSRFNESRYRYQIIKAFSLILLMEMKRQRSDMYADLAGSFKRIHKLKKLSISTYLNSTKLWEKGAKITYFRLTGKLSSWFTKHLDPVLLGFSDHDSMKSWETDCAGLMAQVFELGLPDVQKAYIAQHMKVERVINENNHQLRTLSLRMQLSGERRRIKTENRKMEARKAAIKCAIDQLLLIQKLNQHPRR